MEMQTTSTQEAIAKKLWHIIHVVFFMVRNGISKSKIMLDLHLLLKKGNQLAGKAIGNILSHHHHHHHHHWRHATPNHLSTFSCRSNNAALSFISPQEYEFSCSNSPAFFHHHRSHKKTRLARYDDATTLAAVQRVLEMLNNEAAAVEASPMTYFPGFGKSPMVRQLRITDSPFPLKEEEDCGGDSQLINKAAEEFINRFYKDLKMQKIASGGSLDSPYRDFWSR